MTTQQPAIKYYLTVLHPETKETLAIKDLRFEHWGAVEIQINADKGAYVDRSGLPIKYTAFDGTVELSGSFGVA